MYDNDIERYVDNLSNVFVKNNIVAYELTESTSPQTGMRVMNLNVTNNDIYLKNQVLLEEGFFDITNNSTKYTSFTNEPSKKLANIASSNEYYIQNMSHKNKYGGLLYLKNIEGNFENNVNKAFKQLNEMYPNIEVKISNAYESDIHIDTMMYIIEMFSITIILTLILCSLIFSKLREIGLRKMEGHSNFSIYLEFYEKPFLIFSVIMIMFSIIISLLIYPKNFLTLFIFAKSVLCQLVYILIIQQVISLSLFVLIVYVPISLSIKGKNNLKELQIVTYIMKFGISMLLIPTYISGSIALIDTIKIVSNHSISGNNLKNLYIFGSELQSNYFDYENEEINQSVINTRNEFIEKNNAFFLSGGYLENLRKPGELYSVLLADDQYLIRNELIDEDDVRLKDSIILVNINASINSQIINEYREVVSESTKLETHVIHHDKKLMNYRSIDLLYQPFVKDKIIVYMNDSNNAPRLNGTMFYYTGEDVQKYVDNIFFENGFSSPFTIEPVTSRLEATYRYRVNYNMKYVIPIISMIIAYILISKLFIDIDSEANKVKKFIKITEGYCKYSMKEYLMKSVLPLLLALILLLSTKVVVINKSMIIIVATLFLIETFTYIIVTNLKYKKRRN